MSESIKLWVDDLRQPPPGWHWVRSVTEAIRVLDTIPVLEISVDHDICHTKERSGILIPTGESCNETFEPVVRFLAMMPANHMPSRIVIHTSNPTAAEKLTTILTPRHIARHFKLESKMCSDVPESADW